MGIYKENQIFWQVRNTAARYLIEVYMSKSEGYSYLSLALWLLESLVHPCFPLFSLITYHWFPLPSLPNHLLLRSYSLVHLLLLASILSVSFPHSPLAPSPPPTLPLPLPSLPCLLTTGLLLLPTSCSFTLPPPSFSSTNGSSLPSLLHNWFHPHLPGSSLFPFPYLQ